MILLIVAIAFLIFQITVLAAVINIGSPAIDRAGYYNQGTWIGKLAVADGTGTITEVKIYAKAQMENCKVATFFVVAGNFLTARDAETVDNSNGAGVVLSGSVQTFTVDLDVEIGDYLGIYWGAAGQLEVDVSGGGEWHKTGDQTECVNFEFETSADRTLSLSGTGTTEVAVKKKNVIFMGSNL